MYGISWKNSLYYYISFLVLPTRILRISTYFRAYIQLTLFHFRAFESETSGSNPNSTYTENNSYGQTKADFFERTSHVTHANCSIVRDHINTPIQPNPKSSTYIHSVNQAKESHLSTYWRHTNENTNHFDPGFAIQPSTTEMNLSSNIDHQSYPFSGQVDSSLNEPNSLHSLSCSTTQLIPQSNQEHANIQHHTDPASGDYLSSMPNNYGTLRNGTDFPTSDVQALNNFGKFHVNYTVIISKWALLEI